MKIGIVTTWFERGAAYVSRLYRDVLKEDHDVFIYARGGESKAYGDAQWNDASVWWGKDIVSPFSVTVFDKNDFVLWVKSNGIEVVIFNEQHWWPPLRWCRELGIKSIAYVDYYTEQTVPLFKYYDALICNTKRHYEVFSWHRNAFYLPWGTNIDLFRPKDEMQRLAGGDKPTFFHSCGMDPIRKGTKYVIRAFYKSDVDAKLIIHTQVALLERIPECAEEIKALVGKGRLQVIEKTVTAPGLYHLGDVYIYPSELEGIGLSIAEAISCGLVALVTDNPPMNEFISNEVGLGIAVARVHSRMDGYYWPKAIVSDDDLANKIRELYLNPGKVLSMKKNARGFAIANLDWRRNSKEIGAIVRRVADLPSNVNQGYEEMDAFESFGFRKLNKLFIPFARILQPLLRGVRKIIGGRK